VTSPGLSNPQPRPRQSRQRQIRNPRTRPRSHRQSIFLTPNNILHPLLHIRYPRHHPRQTIQFSTSHPAPSPRMGKSSNDPSRHQKLRRDNGLQSNFGHYGSWVFAVCDFLFVDVLYEVGVGEEVICFFPYGVYRCSSLFLHLPMILKMYVANG
jgi:hypothetical protein